MSFSNKLALVLLVALLPLLALAFYAHPAFALPAGANLLALSATLAYHRANSPAMLRRLRC